MKNIYRHNLRPSMVLLLFKELIYLFKRERVHKQGWGRGRGRGRSSLPSEQGA